jgi:hypothetical protein
MDDYMMQQRYNQILQNKIAMGAGYDDDDDMDYDGGILVGGRRRRRSGSKMPRSRSRKRAPSAFNRAVSAYMRSHRGVSLPQASHAVSGRRSYSKRKPVRRGRGVMVGGRKSNIPAYFPSKSVEQAYRLAERKANKEEIRKNFCNEDYLRKHVTIDQWPEYKRRCKSQNTLERKYRNFLAKNVLGDNYEDSDFSKFDFGADLAPKKNVNLQVM